MGVCGDLLTLMAEDVPQRAYCMPSVFNALRYAVNTGCPWRYLPNDFPPWTVVYQQLRRWVAAKVFESIAQDLRIVVRINSKRAEDPTAVIIDARALQSTPERGVRGGSDGAKRHLISVAARNLGLVMGTLIGFSKQRDFSAGVGLSVLCHLAVFVLEAPPQRLRGYGMFLYRNT